MNGQVGNYLIKFWGRYSPIALCLLMWFLYSSQRWKGLERIVLVIIQNKIRNQKLVSQNRMQCNRLLFLIFGKVVVGNHKKRPHLVGACRICQMMLPILDYLRCIGPDPLVDIFQSVFYVHVFKISFWKWHIIIPKFGWIKQCFQLWRIASNWKRNHDIEYVRTFIWTLHSTIYFTSTCVAYQKITNGSTSDLIDK